MMNQTEYKYEYCTKCGEETDQDNDSCKCGSKNFIYGNNFTYNNGKAVCGCGNDKFKMIFHMNRNPHYNKTYQCSECNNQIGTQTYYESPYY